MPSLRTPPSGRGSRGRVTPGTAYIIIDLPSQVRHGDDDAETGSSGGAGSATSHHPAWYIELKPVRAGLARRAREYQWSSAAAHGLGRNDALVRVRPLLELVGKGQWGKFLGKPPGEEQGELLRQHERTGRPLGGERFLAHLESALSRELRPQKRGPKGPWKHRRTH